MFLLVEKNRGLIILIALLPWSLQRLPCRSQDPRQEEREEQRVKGEGQEVFPRVLVPVVLVVVSRVMSLRLPQGSRVEVLELSQGVVVGLGED